MAEFVKAKSYADLKKKKYKVLEFDGKFKESFGTPELAGAWIIWGDSSAGKTSLNIQLAKYMTQFGQVLYNSFEEKESMSFFDNLTIHGIEHVGSKFQTLPGEDIKTLNDRLKLQRSPNVIFIDSIQHSHMTKEDYQLLKDNHFKNKLFIFVSHASGKLPKGELADFIRFDSELKIRVDLFRAYPTGRMNGGGQFFDVWPERSAQLNSEIPK